MSRISAKQVRKVLDHLVAKGIDEARDGVHGSQLELLERIRVCSSERSGDAAASTDPSLIVEQDPEGDLPF